MFVAVQSFGSIWTARVARPEADSTGPARRAAFYNTTGVLAGGRLRHRSCIYGYVRLNECFGFRPNAPGRVIHRAYESEGLSVWKAQNRLFLRQLMPANTQPDVYLFRISTTDVGWMDRYSAWACDAAGVVSFSEGNGQQEALILLPAFGWVRGEHGTFCVQPRGDRPWVAALARLAQ